MSTLLVPSGSTLQNTSLKVKLPSICKQQQQNIKTSTELLLRTESCATERLVHPLGWPSWGGKTCSWLGIKWDVTTLCCHLKNTTERETSLLCILLYSFLKNVALSISSDLTVPEAEILIYNLPRMAKKKKKFL